MINMPDFQQLVEEASKVKTNGLLSLDAKLELADYVVEKYPEFIKMYEESCQLQLKKLWEKTYGKS